MVLIFLRDWRSALIVVMNIPFALLSAVIFLWAAGQTINIMTLGGLALAVGVLVDEATVEMENIHTQMRPGFRERAPCVEACSRTAMARLLSMFCILAVFVPSFFMAGVTRQLFVPLSLAVGFAMIASYLLSSSLVPVFSTWLLREAGSKSGRDCSTGSGRSTTAISAPSYVFAGRWRSSICSLPWRIYACCFRGWARKFFRTQTSRCFAFVCAPHRNARGRDRTYCSARPGRDPPGGRRGQVAITSDFVGVVPSSYPVDLIHLFTSGPQEAIIQIAMAPGCPEEKRCGSDCAAAWRRNCRALKSPSRPETS